MIKKMTKMNMTYKIMIFYSLLFIIFGLLMDSPKEIIDGMKNIFFESNILLTDYIELAGIGAAFINSGLLSLICISILIKLEVKPTGATLAALWLISGFAFFGKNVLNIWPVIFGVWLYSKFQGEPFKKYVLTAFFGTALSPIVSELVHTGLFPVWQAVSMGILLTTGMGFILAPLASHCLKLHQGYNLYNIGLTAGLLGTITMSVFRAYEIHFEPRLLWSTGNNTIFTILLLGMFSSLIIFGYLLNDKSFKKVKAIYTQPGRMVSDFYIVYGMGPTFINMGVLGIVFTVLILIIGAPLNGPIIGGIFTVVGFGGFGKHLKNVMPVVIGAILSSVLNVWDLSSPGILLAILFSTTLAPISGHFGWPFGILAGFLHVCVVKNVGYLHGGMNLYNNGFAGGLVAIFLVPIITAMKQKFQSVDNVDL